MTFSSGSGRKGKLLFATPAQGLAHSPSEVKSSAKLAEFFFLIKHALKIV